MHHAETIIADELEALGHRVLSVIVAEDVDDPQYLHLTVVCLGEQAQGGTWHRQDLDDVLLRAWVQTRWN
jgi:hypothetical protein